jgi:hypothetical protein
MIIYTLCTVQENIVLNIIMIILADLVYMIMVPSKIIFETINIAAQVVLIYFISVMRTYSIEVGQEMYVQQVMIVVSIFVGIYSIYFALKNFEELITEYKKRKSKE